MRVWCCTVLLVACSGKEVDDTEVPTDSDTDGITDTDTEPLDVDGDGFTDDVDCDDTDPGVFPGATERCNGIDDDCDDFAEEDDIVTLDDSDNFPTIQEALDVSQAGSTIVVCPGTWYENLQIERPVTLRSRDGSLTTLIDGQGEGAVIDATLAGAETIVVDGFAIQNGSEGGIVMAAGSNLEMTGTKIINNNGSWGGGIQIADGTLTDVHVGGNESIGDGGGGGIWMLGGDVVCVGSFIEFNVAWYGGGVGVGANSTLSDCTVKGNVAVDGGGLGVDIGAVLDATGTIVEGNEATGDGGGAHIDGDELIGAEIVDNDGWVGGGVYVDNQAAVLTDVIVRENVSEVRAAGVYLPNGGELVRCDIRDNTAGTGNGGGVFVGQSQVGLLTDTVIENNDGSDGGGVFLDNGASTTMIGGAIRGNSSTSFGGGTYLMPGTTMDFQNTDVSSNLPFDVGTSSLPSGIDLGAIVTVVCTNAGCAD